MKFKMRDAQRLCRNAAALLNGEGAGGNSTEAESIAGAVECLRAALADLTNSLSEITIILCGKCDGKGHTTHEELVNQHKRDYVTRTVHCKKCEGSGRLLQRITTEYTQVGVVTAERIAEILESDVSKHNLSKAGTTTLAGGIVEGLRDHDE